MKRRRFLWGLLSVMVAPVVAKVAPMIETLAPKRVASGGMAVSFGRFTPLLGSLRMRVNLNGMSEAPTASGDADAAYNHLLTAIKRSGERTAMVMPCFTGFLTEDAEQAIRNYAASLTKRA